MRSHIYNKNYENDKLILTCFAGNTPIQFTTKSALPSRSKKILNSTKFERIIIMCEMERKSAVI
jgi:hypothetical protein